MQQNEPTLGKIKEIVSQQVSRIDFRVFFYNIGNVVVCIMVCFRCIATTQCYACSIVSVSGGC